MTVKGHEEEGQDRNNAVTRVEATCVYTSIWQSGSFQAPKYQAPNLLEVLNLLVLENVASRVERFKLEPLNWRGTFLRVEQYSVNFQNPGITKLIG